MSLSEAMCTICEWRPVYAKARCRSCYVFVRRHGADKDETYLVREGTLALERQTLANHIGVVYARA